MFPRPILAAFGFGLLALPAHLLAQEGPSFECAAASTWGEELVCSDAALAALDLRLQGRFTAALAVAEARFPAALPDLRAMQRGWVKGRDDCWKGSDPRGCVEFNYLHREAELVAAWSLEEPTWVATYVCGDKGSEVTAVRRSTSGLLAMRGRSLRLVCPHARPAWRLPSSCRCAASSSPPPKVPLAMTHQAKSEPSGPGHPTKEDVPWRTPLTTTARGPLAQSGSPCPT